jgi:hypothetical protein
MSIGDKLRAIDEHAGNAVPGKQPSQKAPAEGSRETVGVTNRAPGEEQKNQERLRRRGKAKEKGNA